MRRVGLLVIAVALLVPGCVTATDIRPDCRSEDRVLTLVAQAVPSATMLPCLDALLTGWGFAGSQIVDGSFRFWLSSDRAGLQAVSVELTESCDVSGAVEVIPGVDEAGTRRFEEPLSLSPRFAANRYYTFAGGCVSVTYRFGTNDPALVLQADQAISFRPRQELVDRLADSGLVLCGAGAPECPGGD
jgi:hypothetical protein